MRQSALPLLIGDIVAFLISFICAGFIFNAFGHLPAGANLISLPAIVSLEFVGFYFLAFVIGLLFFMQQGHYTLQAPWWQQVKHIVSFCIAALIVFGFYYYAQKEDMSRLFVALSWIFPIPLLMIFRQIFRRILSASGLWDRPTYVIGGIENAIETVYALRSESYIKYDIKMVILPNATPAHVRKFKDIHAGIDVKKNIPYFDRNDFVVICPDARRDMEIVSITQKIKQAGADFAMVPPIEGFSYYGLQPHYMFGYNIVLLQPAIQLHSSLNQILKNIMDRTGALIALILLSPVLAYIAYSVRKDGGDSLFGHERLGKDGQTFKCWKFRSMISNSQEVLQDLLENDPEAQEEWERDFKLKNDPRITPIGNLLRRTSLDELPQLINVLKGEMSLVGPRPIVEDEVKYYDEKINDYYSVRPGVTGLWQVSGRNDVSYDHRVYLDSWYVRHWSVWTDIVIIIKTVMVVALRKGAY